MLFISYIYERLVLPMPYDRYYCGYYLTVNLGNGPETFDEFFVFAHSASSLRVLMLMPSVLVSKPSSASSTSFGHVATRRSRATR